MKRPFVTVIFVSVTAVTMEASPCIISPLNTYLNGGSPFSCTENAAAINSATIRFQHDLLASYVGLSIAGGGSALPDDITVMPGSPGLSFEGGFSASGLLLSSQSEL